jgi:hypothetical protein
MPARQPRRKRAPKARANKVPRLPQPPDHFESPEKRRVRQTPDGKSPSKSVPVIDFEPFRFPG